MGKATILGFSPNLAAMISSGGRISTMEGTAGQIWQKSLALGAEKNERLIGKVVSSGHTSVLNMVMSTCRLRMSRCLPSSF